MGIARGGSFVAGRVFDDAGQRDTTTGEWVRIAARQDDRDACPWVGGQVAAVLGHDGHAEHGCAAEQTVGDERGPRVTVGGERREYAGIRRRGNCACFFCG